MIKNIIFDLGNVLISFQPLQYLQSLDLNAEEVDFIHREIYLSNEWVELDRGTLNRVEALGAICARNPQRAELLISHSDFMKVLTPIEYNASQLEGLKKQGYKLYYLTNYHDDLFEICYNSYTFFKHFEGGIVSARIKYIKPQPEIYKTLMNNYQLSPGESLFIDDSETNTRAAEELGIQAHHLSKPEELKSHLKKLLE